MKYTEIILGLFLMTSCYHQKAEKQISTIDDTLQSKVTSILDNRMKELNASVGQVIVMDVQTGEIKALVRLERKYILIIAKMSSVIWQQSYLTDKISA